MLLFDLRKQEEYEIPSSFFSTNMLFASFWRSPLDALLYCFRWSFIFFHCSWLFYVYASVCLLLASPEFALSSTKLPTPGLFLNGNLNKLAQGGKGSPRLTSFNLVYCNLCGLCLLWLSNFTNIIQTIN